MLRIGRAPECRAGVTSVLKTRTSRQQQSKEGERLLFGNGVLAPGKRLATKAGVTEGRKRGAGLVRRSGRDRPSPALDRNASRFQPVGREP
jgi:hypothetical protein